jgi:hypothetical protein
MQESASKGWEELRRLWSGEYLIPGLVEPLEKVNKTLDEGAKAATGMSGALVDGLGNAGKEAEKLKEQQDEFLSDLRLEIDAFRRGLSDSDKEFLKIVQAGEKLKIPRAQVEMLARELMDARAAAALTAEAIERIKQANRSVVSAQKEIALLEKGFTGTKLEIEQTVQEWVALGESEEVARPIIERLYELRDATKDSEVGFVDLFDVFHRGFSEMMEGVILGTRNIGDAFEGMKASIVRSFVDAFAEGWKEKLGFEGKFKINIAQFVGNIGGILKGGNLEGLFGGVFQGGAGGGAGGAGGSGFLTAQIGRASCRERV